MKMVKKILLGLAAATVAIGMIGCKNVDDEKKAIEGSGSNYSIDFTEEDGTIYRAYKSTALQHSGALVKITFDKADPNNYSKMGVIFDLDKNKDNKDAKDFYIIGLAGMATGDKNFYVSKFESIVDLQADNFGAPSNGGTGTNGEKETEYVALNKDNRIKNLPTAAANGNISYYIYFKAFPNEGDNATKGYFEWAVLSMTDEVANTIKIKTTSLSELKQNSSITILKSDKITNAFDLKKNGDVSYVPQNQLAVYAMITANHTLKGTWKFIDLYKEAEEIVE